MDDLYAPEGGGSATAWQRKHNARKNREAAIKNRHALRAAEKDDLKKRLKKWRALTKKAKAEGWVPLARRRWRNGEGKVVSLGRPRILKKPIWIDMTGWRFGRLTVMRICPTSQNHRAQRCRLWWVKCDCGSTEKRVNGTSLRQGNCQSCGCYKRERTRAGVAKRVAKRNKLLASPMSIRCIELRRRIRKKERITRADVRLLDSIYRILVEEEVRNGVRRRGKSGRPMLVRAAGAGVRGCPPHRQTLH
jgi:hypothetical protein